MTSKINNCCTLQSTRVEHRRWLSQILYYEQPIIINIHKEYPWIEGLRYVFRNKSHEMSAHVSETRLFTSSACFPRRDAPRHASHLFNSGTCRSLGLRPLREAPGTSASTKEYRSSILPPTTLDWFKKYICDFGQPSVLQISQKSRLPRLQLIAYTASPLIKDNRGVEIYKTRLRQEPKNQIAIKYSAKPSKVIQSPNGQDSSTPIRFKFFRYACPMT